MSSSSPKAPRVLEKRNKPSGSSSKDSTASRNTRQSVTSLYSPATQPALVVHAHTQGSGEEFWSRRALTAETLLVAQTHHHNELRRELRTLSYNEERRRSRELDAVKSATDEKLHKLERLVMVLIGIIAVLIAFVMYMALRPHSQPVQQRGSRLAHFTIPVLSPFASVVEHETSAVGSKTIISGLVISAVLVYFLVARRFPLVTPRVA